jgi:hypothetical protein
VYTVIFSHFKVFIFQCSVRGQEKERYMQSRGGGSRAANSDRGLVLGVGMSRRTGSLARPRRAFFSDSDSDSDEAFQISRKLGLVHIEFFCVLVQQLWIGDVFKIVI